LLVIAKSGEQSSKRFIIIIIIITGIFKVG